jgi:gluconolactonase
MNNPGIKPDPELSDAARSGGPITNMVSFQEEVGLDQLEVFAEGLDHPEGIAVTPGGEMFVGGEVGQIYRVGDDGTVTEIASTGGFNLGLSADGAGRLYVCDSTAGVVWRVGPGTGDREVFTKGLPDRPARVPNWGCFDGHGNYYLTDSGDWGATNGLIWVVRPGGRTEVWTEAAKAFPNGCAVAPDGSRLFVAESYPSALVEISIMPDGSAGPRRVLDELGTIVPDGVAVADDGSLVVACYRPDAVLMWDSTNGLRLLACDPRGTLLSAPTNVVFTGDDLDVLIVPNLGRWHLTTGRLGVRGTPLFYPSDEQLQ